MTDLAGKYKTYRLISPFMNEIYTADPANIEYILKTNFGNYGKGLEEFQQCGFQEKVAKFAYILSKAANSANVVDIQELFMNATLDSIFRVGCGIELDSISGSSVERKRFSEAFDNASVQTLWRYVDIYWKIKRALNVRSEAKLRDNIRTVDQFVYKLIRRKTEQINTPEADLSAASEKEDNATDVTDFAANLSEDALEKMQYFHAADGKIDDTLPDGFSVNKGDMVSYQPYAMGRMKFIWGDDAEEYKPERWLYGNGFFRQERPFKFTAFQAGPRIRLGKEFAYRQMKIFSGVLLRYFVFKLSDDKKSVSYRTMINLHIDGGLHVKSLSQIGPLMRDINIFKCPWSYLY
ncbi:unnamed protein product [Withania somnifera]